VRTKDSPRHEEGVRTNGIALRANTVTHAVARADGPLRTRCRCAAKFAARQFGILRIEMRKRSH
jgi:hypothetical protein